MLSLKAVHDSVVKGTEIYRYRTCGKHANRSQSQQINATDLQSKVSGM